jgi:hypothetical protein
VALLAAPLFVSWQTIRRISTVAKVFIPLAISFALLAWYNEVRFGKLFVSAYGGASYSTPVLHGLHGLLFSWGKSLFVFNPVAIIGVVGLVAMFWRRRPLAVLFTLVIVVRLVLVAKWSAWAGGVCYGPRLIMPLMVLLVISGVDLLDAAKSRTTAGTLVRAGFVLLILPTLWINFLSVRIPYEQWGKTLATPSLRVLNPTARALVKSTSQAAQVETFTFSGADFMGDYDLLTDGQGKMAPELWQKGDGYLGWILLGLSALLLVCAALMSAKFPRRGNHARAPTRAPALNTA